MESEYFMYWVCTSRRAAQRECKAWSTHPLARCLAEGRELRDRCDEMSPEERRKAAWEAADWTLLKGDFQVSCLMAFCILINEHYEDMDKETLLHVCELFRCRPFEKFEYFMEMEARPEHHRAALAKNFLNMIRKIRNVYEPWEEALCMRTGDFEHKKEPPADTQ